MPAEITFQMPSLYLEIWYLLSLPFIKLVVTQSTLPETQVLTLKLSTEKYSLLIQTKNPAVYQKGEGAANNIWKMLHFII